MLNSIKAMTLNLCSVVSFLVLQLNTNANGLNEMALLSLQQLVHSHVDYAAPPALHLSVMQTYELNVCWNMVFHRIFQYDKWESVRAVIDGCGRLDVRNLILWRKIQFYRRIFYRNDCVLHKLFCALMLSDSMYVYDKVHP